MMMRLGSSMLLALTVAAMASSALAQGTSAPAGDIAGMSKEAIARIAPVMQQQIEKGIFPGAVTLIARHGQVVHHEAHGFLDAAKTKPMTKDALFRLASMTKPIVSVAAVMLVEQGAMKLNDPITNWLPELKDLKVETQKATPDGSVATEDVPLSRPIWVQDLLRHTAGFVYAGSTKSPRIKEMYDKANIEARETDITGEAMLKALGTIPLAHQPGTFWEYSIAVDVLGLLLERLGAPPRSLAPLDRRVRETASLLSMLPDSPRTGRVNPRWRVVENDHDSADQSDEESVEGAREW